MRRLEQNRRVLIVMCGVSLAFTALAGRLVQLHVLRHERLRAEAAANHNVVVKREGRRGEIRDCNGNLLANSQSVRIVCADPAVTATNAAAVAAQLAPLLNMDGAALQKRLAGAGRYVRLKQKVDEDTVQRIRGLRLKGISFEDQFLRVYPHGALGSHLIGFVDANHKGVQGVEAAMDQYLAGVAGYETIQRDRKGREVRALRMAGIEPRDGCHVVLTLDQVIQHIAEAELEVAMREFRPQAGMIIVSRPGTGEILAMAVRPTFDPNRPGDASADARRNRCISDVAEPGSTFKVVSIAGALNDGAVRLQDVFHCENGAFLYAGRILHDAHPYGPLTVEQILYKSSNIGAAKIALKMGAARLHEYIRRFGFGRRTGIGLPGEASGIAHPLAQWTKLSISRIPMGHEIAVTPIQMLMAVNAIANGGRLMRPLVVKQVVDGEGRTVVEFRPQVVGQPISASTSLMMTAALRRVPTPDGTAPLAAMDGYDVAGKTGTAQKIENGQYVRKYYSSFVGYLPAAAPEISILVTLDDPGGGRYYGGSVAGPVFRRVAEKLVEYLGIPPQKPLSGSRQVASAR
ncbi:MAG: penicillin-binding protein 2 [Verrucomicrobiae bacterium]|nr:penicillin-binding protein 2 [Verrucomicrobiae bacterium]